MAAILKKLGIPKDVRLFFEPYYTVCSDGSLRFYHGEHFARDFHLVPNAVISWRAGNGPLVLIAWSAMECLAFLALNRFRFPELSSLSFIALGTSLTQMPPEPSGKVTLLFGRDLLGRLADVAVSNRVNGKNTSIRYAGGEKFIFTFKDRSVTLPDQLITLNAVEKGLAIRNAISTLKPKSANSFLEQLLKQNL